MRFKAKTVYKLIDEKGIEIVNGPDILDQEHMYYQELYANDDRVKFCLVNDSGVEVTIEEREAQNTALSVDELTCALCSLKNGKCPGYDGLTTDFYKVFWCKLKNTFKRVLDVTQQEGLMTESQRHGVLNLIPKGNKDSRFLKNLRPITLLNTDYKIIEKVIANRMQKSLERIVHEDQRGFLPGRKIACNIRKAFDILNYCNQEKVDAILFSLDFQKCFDQISMSAITGALKYFKFSDFICDWTEILYRQFFVTIQNNGKFSQKVWVNRSVHQGGCCSVNYFLLIAEILAITLRTNRKIQGIPVNDIIYLLSQFADDMDLYVKFSQGNLNNIEKIFNEFWESTGFSLSYDKTKILRIGSLKDSDAKLYSQKKLQWTNDPINILGIWVGK